MAESTPRPTSTELVPIGSLRPNPANARRHSKKQITKLAASIREFGFNVPVVIDETSLILAGHARFEAAAALKMREVPCIRLSHLSPEQKTAFAIADNKLGDLSDFDPDALRVQLATLAEVEFNLELTGFDTAEIDLIIDPPVSSASSSDPADSFELPTNATPPTSRLGDLWRMRDHRLLCGDALQPSSYERLLPGSLANMIFTDPPYNVSIAGHVSGLGRVEHREFAMASGEMSKDEFRAFLITVITHLVFFSTKGSIHYLCMDWRSIRLLLEVGEAAYDEFKNLCVWAKSNGGMGALYRSQHELVAVFKKGRAPHVNNVELGKNGRYRTNVWSYAGANAFSATRDADLAAHPTVKPVGLVADAIRDCSRRGQIILDPFIGSGTTILAAQRTGRRGMGIELDPQYVDTAVMRWERMSGEAARLDGCGRTFAEVQRERAGDVAAKDLS